MLNLWMMLENKTQKKLKSKFGKVHLLKVILFKDILFEI